MVLARRHSSQWYVAALNGTAEPLSLSLSLPMLAGEEVELYYETADRKSLWPKSAVKKQKVGKDGRLKITMQPMGGSIACAR